MQEIKRIDKIVGSKDVAFIYLFLLRQLSFSTYLIVVLQLDNFSYYEYVVEKKVFAKKLQHFTIIFGPRCLLAVVLDERTTICCAAVVYEIAFFFSFFSATQVLTVVSQDQSGWWTGEKGGRKGLFPSNYVSLM